MELITPKSPPYDPVEWAAKPFPEKARMVCQAWALQGYGSPAGVYLVYALKLVAYIYGWAFFCSFTPGMGEMGSVSSWWLNPIAFQKAIIWNLMFEVMGLGCGSGPLTGRYMPPIGGFLYFLRPGTTKLPVFENVPLIGGHRRNVLDVVLYLALLVFCVLAMVSPAPGMMEFLPIALLLPALGILDKTIFLAARSEHYWVVVLCFIFAGNWIAAVMAVQAAIWFFAGVSKLNHHFPATVGVMTSNGPLTPWKWFRKSMYRNYPDDLNPSEFAKVQSYMGTVLELGVPIVLLTAVFSGSPLILTIGLVMMVGLHSYITSNVPMGVPIEWNVLVVYSGFFLFMGNSHLTPLDIGSLPLSIFLFLSLLVIPILGNIKPELISFLLAMRYYAGNWACSVWLIKKGAEEKLETNLTKSSPWIFEQLNKLYEPSVGVGLVGKVMAFRLMHLHGRAFQTLIPKLVGDKFNDYVWLDGELIAGMVLGYNFGEGHLHNEQLLRAIQKQCNFEEGEVRCVFMESQPLGKSTMEYRLADASSGEIEKGMMDVNELRKLQAWPLT